MSAEPDLTFRVADAIALIRQAVPEPEQQTPLWRDMLGILLGEITLDEAGADGVLRDVEATE